MLLKFKMMLSVLFSILFFSGTAFPQNDSIVQAESSLVAILKECRLAKNDSLRLALNDRFAEMLATTLDLPQSRLSPFDSLNIGKLTSTDGKIRIFNWNIQQNDRSNIYSIIIQNIAKDTIIRLKTIASRRCITRLPVRWMRMFRFSILIPAWSGPRPLMYWRYRLKRKVMANVAP